MENKEDVLDALEEFAKKPTDKVPPMLDQYLGRVAQTGETLFPWSKVRPLFVHKLEVQMKAFDEWIPMDDLDPLPNVENVTFTEIQTRLMKYINSFSSAPFTIQRLCELVTDPRKHYRRVDKWLRGVEKNLLVVSSVDPFGNKIVCEPKPMVNGLDANGYDQHELGDESVAASPFLPPPPPSSVQGSPVSWRENSCLTMSPGCTWAAGTNGTPPHTTCDDPSEASGIPMEAAMASPQASSIAPTSTVATSASSDSSGDDSSDGEPQQKRIKLSDNQPTDDKPKSPLQTTADDTVADSTTVPVSSETPAPSTSDDTETPSAVCPSTETIADKEELSEDDKVGGGAENAEPEAVSAEQEEEEMEADSAMETDQDQGSQPSEETESKTVEEEKEAAAARREESIAEATEQSNSSGFDTPVEGKTMEECEAVTSFEAESSDAADCTSPTAEPRLAPSESDANSGDTKPSECDSDQSDSTQSSEAESTETKESAKEAEMESTTKEDSPETSSTTETSSSSTQQEEVQDTKSDFEQTSSSGVTSTSDADSTATVTVTTAAATSAVDTSSDNSSATAPEETEAAATATTTTTSDSSSSASSSSSPPAAVPEAMETD